MKINLSVRNTDFGSTRELFMVEIHDVKTAMR
jgi:hypothetical protein